MTGHSGFFIDANLLVLLVLLVVGSVGREFVGKHRRLRGYTAADYDILAALISRVDRLLATPHTLAEASNLLAQHGDPEKTRFFRRFRVVIQESEEVFVSADAAAGNAHFERLGLADAALLEAVSENAPLLTADANLHAAALENGLYAAVRFEEFRSLYADS